MRFPPLHVDDALPADAVALAFPFRDRAVDLEHGIEMAEQEQALALATFAGGHQMASPLQFRRQVDPACTEAQLLEFSSIHLADFAHTGVVHGSAVDVDALFEHADRFVGAGPHSGCNALFDRRKRSGFRVHAERGAAGEHAGRHQQRGQAAKAIKASRVLQRGGAL